MTKWTSCGCCSHSGRPASRQPPACRTVAVQESYNYYDVETNSTPARTAVKDAPRGIADAGGRNPHVGAGCNPSVQGLGVLGKCDQVRTRGTLLPPMAKVVGEVTRPDVQTCPGRDDRLDLVVVARSGG